MAEDKKKKKVVYSNAWTEARKLIWNAHGRQFVSSGMAMIFCITSTLASPGDLDKSFGQGGRVFTDIAIIEPPAKPLYPVLFSTVVQPDGKIIVGGGYWEDAISEYYGSFLVRYMPDGTLDKSFGSNGKVVFRTDYDFATDMALQPDGKIVTIGSSVRRYTSSGMVDTTFGNAGTVQLPANEGHAIKLQPDGKILGVGSIYSPPYPTKVFRLNADGTFDITFGQSGTGVLTLIERGGQEILVQQNGRILIVGTSGVQFSLVSEVSIVRFDSNGIIDTTFGTGGSVRHPINDQNFGVAGAALQPDGKIVVTGNIYLPAYASFVSRFNPDGSLDTGFGTNGGDLSFSLGFLSPTVVSVTQENNLVVAGFSYDGLSGLRNFAVVRLTSNGTLDSGFGVGGRSTVPMNAGGINNAYPSSGAIQPDGNILITGYFGFYFTDSHEYLALARFLGHPSTVGPEVFLSGRVTRSSGSGISNARITIVDDVGNVRYSRTNPFGHYRFLNITPRLNYSVNVFSKRDRFQKSSRSIFPTATTTGIDFVSNP